MARVLITGGTGLVGKRLSGRLREKGYEVFVLSRKAAKDSPAGMYSWNPDRHEIDRNAVNGSDYIIHLAGLGIGDRRWTVRRKQDIISSRVNSGELVFSALDQDNNQLKAFISASAIGYYGAVSVQKIFVESDQPGNDFLGQTCQQWEAVADRFSGIGIRSVRIRIGVVLSKGGGALKKLTSFIKTGFGAAIGSGKQYMPWIHLDDLCDIFIKSIEDVEMEGAYNAVAPQHVTNKELTRKIARKLKRPLWLPPIPAIVMKVIYGRMSDILLKGSRVSSAKIEASGFRFKYPTLEEALDQIYL